MIKIWKIKQYEKYFDSLPRKKEPLTLGRIQKLLGLLKNPERKLTGIHIAGTNGKGSTAAILQSILTQNGYKVGLYTSPHLVSACERFRIGYQRISEKELIKYLERLKGIVKKIKKEKPTWFEILTAVAILYFLDKKVDLAIFETGLGGRGDATNVLNLGIEVITSISLDHQKFLGRTIENITKEKREIIKQNSIVVTSLYGKPLRLIKEKCQKAGARLFTSDQIKIKLRKIDFEKMVCDIFFSFGRLKDAQINLVGIHQLENLALAFKTVEILKNQGYYFNLKKIRNGLAKIDWPGRFQILNKNPLIIIDSAHNPGGMKVLVETCQKLTSKKWIVIFAVKKSKDIKKMLSQLKKISSVIIFPKVSQDKIKFYSPFTLKKYYSKGKIVSSWKEALVFAKNYAQISKKPILICGSIYFLGEILENRR